MTSITQFTQTPCPSLDAHAIDACFRLYLDPINPAILHLETSWGDTKVDLTDAILQVIKTHGPTGDCICD